MQQTTVRDPLKINWAKMKRIKFWGFRCSEVQYSWISSRAKLMKADEINRFNKPPQPTPLVRVFYYNAIIYAINWFWINTIAWNIGYEIVGFLIEFCKYYKFLVILIYTSKNISSYYITMCSYFLKLTNSHFSSKQQRFQSYNKICTMYQNLYCGWFLIIKQRVYDGTSIMFPWNTFDRSDSLIATLSCLFAYGL